MTTPCIEEILYKAIQDEVASEMWYESRQNEKRLQKLLQNLEKRLIRDTTTALTEAKQAGIDEGKFQERVKWETYQDQVESIFAWLHGENGDFPDLSQKPHYSFRSQLRTMRKALDDTTKALQDKK
jgi:hypothetical protein